jgi:hypothetical protein
LRLLQRFACLVGAGFQLAAPPVCPKKKNGPNGLAAYRIHGPDPVLFHDTFVLQWQPTGGGTAPKMDCNGGWPQTDGLWPPPDAEGDRSQGTVSITTHAWVYTYDR